MAVTGQQEHGSRWSELLGRFEDADALRVALELDVAQQNVRLWQQQHRVVQRATRAGQDEVVGLVDRSSDGRQD